MKYLKKSILLTLCFFVSFVVSAKDTEDQAALQKILATFTSYSAKFEQTISNAMGEELQKSSGTIALGKPSKLRWQVTYPDESLLIADGESVFNIDPFVEQVTILGQEDVIATNPLSLLITNDKDAWQSVKVEKSGDFFVVWSTDPQASVKAVKLSFDQNNRLTNLVATDAQGQINDIAFSDIKVNPMLSLNTFIPEIQDSYEIDDQR
ncbi:outer membrane lipoprotein chaperone LolA [Glaciecola sp. 1036]|uniref:outer membrane lipoprotein chaperone LolA n=1 Tax=Alteromonadaceae TaxID=72275 RepID=UPI003D0957A0